MFSLTSLIFLIVCVVDKVFSEFECMVNEGCLLRKDTRFIRDETKLKNHKTNKI